MAELAGAVIMDTPTNVSALTRGDARFVLDQAPDCRPRIRDLADRLPVSKSGVTQHAKVVYDLSGGLSAVGDGYAQSGVPVAEIAGPANVLFEWVGGVAMALGIAVPLVGVGMAINMVGAWVFVHNTALYSVEGGGPEVVIAIGLLSLLIAALGSDRYGVDHLLFGRKRAGRTTADATT